jgi:magnesium-transporting ATPase (P-type)
MSAPAPQTALTPKANVGDSIDLEKIPVDKVLAKLAVEPDQGLSSAEAHQRLGKYGPNALIEKETSLARKLLGHFTGPIAYMIEAAAIVSAVIGHWSDFAIITGLLFFNAALEFWQDRKASDALAALKKGWPQKRQQCATASGRRCKPRCWCPVTSSRFGSASSCRLIFDLPAAITLRSISQH